MVGTETDSISPDGKTSGIDDETGEWGLRNTHPSDVPWLTDPPD